MNNQPSDDDDIPAEIDFSKGVRGLHHIPPDAKVRMPASVEQQGIDLSDLLTEVLKRHRDS